MARMLGRARRRPFYSRDDEWFTDRTGARRAQRHREAAEVRSEVFDALPTARDAWDLVLRERPSWAEPLTWSQHYELWLYDEWRPGWVRKYLGQ
jgi:hypothetical protein